MIPRRRGSISITANEELRRRHEYADKDKGADEVRNLTIGHPPMKLKNVGWRRLRAFEDWRESVVLKIASLMQQ